MKSLKMLLRFAIVGGLILLLLIPLMMIKGVIKEREAYRDEAYLRALSTHFEEAAREACGSLRVCRLVTAAATLDLAVDRRVGHAQGDVLRLAVAVGRVRPARAVGEEIEVLRVLLAVRLPPPGEGMRGVHGAGHREAVSDQPRRLLSEEAVRSLNR